MSNNLSEFLKGIADAIRAKKGSQSSINPQDFATEIGNLPVGSDKALSIINRSITTLDAEDFGDITTIGDYAFAGCYDLTSVSLPNTITSLGYMAFMGCGMTSFDMGNSITSIGMYSFANSNSLTSVTISSSLTEIPDFAFQETGLESIIIPNGVTTIGYAAFDSCHSATSISIPSSVSSTAQAFSGCGSVTSISVDANNATLDSRDNCNAIIETATNTLITGCQTTIIPNDIEIIGFEAFCGCWNLSNIVIPESVTTISTRAFAFCDALTEITIPSGVTSIGESAFYGCSNCTSITINAVNPPDLAEPTIDFPQNVFDDTNDCPIYVPVGTVTAYQSAPNWSNYASRIQEIQS